MIGCHVGLFFPPPEKVGSVKKYFELESMAVLSNTKTQNLDTLTKLWASYPFNATDWKVESFNVSCAFMLGSLGNETPQR